MKIENLEIKKDPNNWILEETVETTNKETGEKGTRIERYYFPKVDQLLKRLLDICIKNNMSEQKESIEESLSLINSTLEKITKEFKNQ